MYQEIDDRLLGVCCEFFGIEDQMEEFYDYDILMSYSEMVVWAETNISYLAKLTAMNVDLEPARDPEWLDWVRHCPRENHWEHSEERWLNRYDELF
jgi:hypothetical protein